MKSKDKNNKKSNSNYIGVENLVRRENLISKTENPMRMAEMASILTDPFGSYTGVPEDPMERPVQDVDDL